MTFEEFYTTPFPDWPGASLERIVEGYVSEYLAGPMAQGEKAVREEIEKLWLKDHLNG